MSIIGSNILAGASGQGGGGYTIENSLRFRSSASAYLSRTPASAGNRKTWTWSGWVKLSAIGQWEGIFNAGSSGNQFAMYLYTDSTLYIQDYTGSNNIYLQTTQVFRDPSAWYHIIFAVDTTQATSTNRFKLYVNGSQVTSFVSTTYPSQNYDTQVNSTSYQNNIGLNYQFGTSNAKYFDGYMTEVNFIDGQALDPSSFGEYNVDSGVWQPVAYAGTYGDNGFYLPFSDATNTTTLAADSSGNGNDWTPNNISLTAGVTYDSMTDTPTIYAGGGNYAVMNPLDNSNFSVSNGNLKATGTTSTWQAVRSTFAYPSGSWYTEIFIDSGTSNGNNFIGVTRASDALSTMTGSNLVGTASTAWAYSSNGNIYNSGSISTATGITWAANDTVAVTFDGSSVKFYKNNSLVHTQSSLTGEYVLTLGAYSTGAFSVNFGQRSFAYTPPAGFLPLHTSNLPDSAIVDGSQYINAVLWAGDNNARSITGMNFQPDFLWTKSRSTSENHRLMDSVRGDNGTVMYELASNDNTVEAVDGLVSSLDADGFSIAAGGNSPNVSGRTYVGWGWKANGAGVSNTDGSITSTVSANPTSGFSIVTYTGTGAIGATVGHGLTKVPSLIIQKPRSAGTSDDNWHVYHSSLGATKALILNGTGAESTSAVWWNNTAPTSTVLTVGGTGAVGYTNNSGSTYLLYCFAEVEGYSKFGSYTGNGSPDGPFVLTGCRPALVMIKRTNSSGAWTMLDTARDEYNEMDTILNADATTPESSFGVTNRNMDFLSNGFKIRSTAAGGTTDLNASGGNYIYMAFAENPFKNSLAR